MALLRYNLISSRIAQGCNGQKRGWKRTRVIIERGACSNMLAPCNGSRRGKETERGIVYRDGRYIRSSTLPTVPTVRELIYSVDIIRQ